MKRGLYGKLIGYHQLERYSNPVPKSGRIFEGRKGKWYLTVQYEVDSITRQAHREPIGIDRNVGQCYGSNGIKYKLSELNALQNRIKCLQKWRAKKVKGSRRYNKLSFTIASYHSKIKHIRTNDLRHIAKEIASASDLVYLEDLKAKNLTKSARGTVDDPGRNVKQQSGLNGVILDSGWYKLEQFLKEQAVVHKIDPKYTSQKCSACGYTDKGNRTNQSKFRCMSCELEMNADFNASLNILASGMGTIKTGRREYIIPIIRDTYSLKRRNNTSAF